MAYALAAWSAPRPTRVLVWAVLGGMALRITLLLAAAALAIGVARLPAVAFIVSLVAYFALYLLLELIALPRLFRVVTP